MKKSRFWGIPGLCLCLVFASCRTMMPFNAHHKTWSVYAEMVPGTPLEQFYLTPDSGMSAPEYFLSGDTLVAIGLVTGQESSALRLREQILATGLVRSVKIAGVNE